MSLDSTPNTLSNGYKLVQAFLDIERLNKLQNDIAPELFVAGRGGIRHADKKILAVAQLAQSRLVMDAVHLFLGPGAQLSRAIVFNKTQLNNWQVGWHQDKTVAVAQKFAAPGWHTWSVKERVHHVQPPLSVLDNIITLRVHLDDCLRENGCLQVIAKSHKKGILSDSNIKKCVASSKVFYCEAMAGDLLLMRPHILHASAKAQQVGLRRRVHLEYCAQVLPSGINWA